MSVEVTSTLGLASSVSLRFITKIYCTVFSRSFPRKPAAGGCGGCEGYRGRRGAYSGSSVDLPKNRHSAAVSFTCLAARPPWPRWQYTIPSCYRISYRKKKKEALSKVLSKVKKTKLESENVRGKNIGLVIEEVRCAPFSLALNFDLGLHM